jgi:hypothetical protein
VPATTRFAAPIVCPAEHERSVVVTRTSSNGRGKTTMTSELWCVFPGKDRFPERANQLLVLLTIFGEYLLIAAAFALFAGVATGPRREL